MQIFTYLHIFRHLQLQMFKFIELFLAWKFKHWIIFILHFKVKIFAYLSKFIFKVINFLRFNEKFPWTPSFIFSFVFSKPLRIKPQHSITYVQSRINEGFCVTVTRLTCDEMCDTFEAFDC